MYEDIPEALKQADDDPNISLIVITGSGDFFSSGNDLSNYLKPTDDPEAEILKGSKYLEYKISELKKNYSDHLTLCF